MGNRPGPPGGWPGGLEVFGLLGLVAGPTIVAAAMGVFRVHVEHRDRVAEHQV